MIFVMVILKDSIYFWLKKGAMDLQFCLLWIKKHGHISLWNMIALFSED